MKRVMKNFLDCGLSIYLIISIILIISYIWVTNNKITIDSIHILTIAAIGILIIAVLWKSTKSTLSIENIIFIIIIFGCIIRIGYALFNDVFVRAHDLWNFDDYEAAGKGGYLMWIVSKGKLPDSYAHQYYHQPFSYLASAVFCKIVQPLLDECNSYTLGSAGKLAPCLASCGILFLTPKLCKVTSIPQKAIVVITILVATYPAFFLVSGRIGEDAFSCYFAMAEILYSIYWYRKPTIKNSICLALFYGFGVSTNLTCCLPAILTIIFFCIRLKKDKEFRGVYLLRIGLFALISLPLGLWYYVRSYILFGISFTYTFPQTVGGPLWRGDYSLWDRFKILDLKNIIASPFAFPYSDFNLPTYMLKSELFGEFLYEVNTEILYTLLILNIIFTGLAFFFLIRTLVKKTFESNYLSLYLMFLVYFIFTIYSYWKYPFGCSMDARYFLIYTILKIFFFGIWYGKIIEKKEKKLYMMFSKFICICVYIFAMLSSAMFCIIK